MWRGYVVCLQFIQKRDPKYCEVKEETAWSMDKFNDYINENVAPNKDLPQDWVYGHLDVRFILCQKNCAVLEICRGRGSSVCTWTRGAVAPEFW